MRDPLVRLTTTSRLWAAAALCLIPLGLLWSYRPGLFTPGVTSYGSCDPDSGVCAPDLSTPGIYLPGSVTSVVQSPVRGFLVLACAGFVLVALRVRTPATRRIARAATLSLAVAAVLAASHGSGPTLALVLAALALAAPPIWRRPHPGRSG